MKDKLLHFTQCAIAGACFWFVIGFSVWFFDELLEDVTDRKVFALKLKCVGMREIPIGACSRLFEEK